jgi:hypothetical protein
LPKIDRELVVASTVIGIFLASLTIWVIVILSSLDKTDKISFSLGILIVGYIVYNEFSKFAKSRLK